MALVDGITISAIFIFGASNLYFVGRVYDNGLENHRDQMERLGLRTARTGVFWFPTWGGPNGFQWIRFAFAEEYFDNLRLRKIKKRYRWSTILFESGSKRKKQTVPVVGRKYGMKIEHIAIWTKDLEVSRAFYSKFFGAMSGDKYLNEKKGFSSYFLNFESGCRIEIMNMMNVEDDVNEMKQRFSGISHFAISVGTKKQVEEITNQIRENKFAVVSEPRQTGDGYYESVVLDPDGNRVEITI